MADRQLSISVHFLFWLLLLSHVLADKKRSADPREYCWNYGCLHYYPGEMGYSEMGHKDNIRHECEEESSEPFVIHGPRQQEAVEDALETMVGADEVWLGARIELEGNEECEYADAGAEHVHGRYTCWADKNVVCYKPKPEGNDCPDGFYECFHECVKKFPGKKTWFLARQKCQQEGLMMLTKDIVERHEEMYCDQLGTFWLRSDVHQLTWADGSREEKTFWNDGAPKKPAPDDVDCLMLHDKDRRYGWDTEGCEQRRPHLCYAERERPAPEPTTTNEPEMETTSTIKAPRPPGTGPGTSPDDTQTGAAGGTLDGPDKDSNEIPTAGGGGADDGPGNGGDKEQSNGDNGPPNGTPEPESPEDPESKGKLSGVEPMQLVVYIIIPLICVIVGLIAVMCYMRIRRRKSSDAEQQKKVLRQQSGSYGSNLSGDSRRYIMPPSGGSGEVNAGYMSLETPGYVRPPYAELNQDPAPPYDSLYSEPSNVYESLPDPPALVPPQVPPPRAEPPAGAMPSIPINGEYSYAVPQVDRQQKATTDDAPAAEYTGYLEVLPDP